MSLIAVLSMFATMSFAQSISFDEVTVAPGDETVVKVYLTGAADGCSGLGFRLGGQPEGVTITNAELNKSVFTDAGASVSYNLNKKNVYIMNYSNNNQACTMTSDKTEMGSFTIAATDKVAEGSITLDVTVIVVPNKDSANNGTIDATTFTFTVGEATGINEVSAQNENAPIYSISGARMNGNLQKGIYVQNGRKFIVK